MTERQFTDREITEQACAEGAGGGLSGRYARDAYLAARTLAECIEHLRGYDNGDYARHDEAELVEGFGIDGYRAVTGLTQIEEAVAFICQFGKEIGERIHGPSVGEIYHRAAILGGDTQNLVEEQHMADWIDDVRHLQPLLTGEYRSDQ